MQSKKSRKIFIYFFLLILLGSINNVSLNKIDFTQVKNIKITGLDDVHSKVIRQKVQNLDLKNLFFLKSAKINHVINSNGLVENFKIFKIYPSTLDIHIKKTSLLAKINLDNELYYVGSNGKLLNSNFTNDELPYIFGKPDIQEFLIFKKIIDNSEISFKEIKSLYFFQSKRWDIKLKNNILIKLSNKNIKVSLDNAYKFLNNSSFEDVKIIDARIKDQIIING